MSAAFRTLLPGSHPGVPTFPNSENYWVPFTCTFIRSIDTCRTPAWCQGLGAGDSTANGKGPHLLLPASARETASAL